MVIGLRTGGARQADIRRRQPDLRGGAGLLAQRQRGGGQAQALSQRQVDIAIKAEQAIRQQGQVVETAGLDTIDAQARRAIAQRRVPVAGHQVAGQAAIALQARHHQFARHAHRVFDDESLQVDLADDAVVRCFQVQRQGAAGRARATGRRMHAAVEEQATEGTERDAAAVAGHQHAALAGQVKRGRCAGRFQARTGTQHDKGVGRLDPGGVKLVPGADLDGAAAADMAIHAPLGIDGGGRAAGHVEHRAVADPDRLGIGAAIRTIALVTGDQQARQHGNAPAGGTELAFHRDLAIAGEADALPLVHTQRGALADHQRRLGAAGTGRQRDIGAGALRQHALDGVFLPQRRQPRLQGGGRIGAAGQRARQRRVGAQHRHRHVDGGALRHLHALLATDVVVCEAALEQGTVQYQQRLDRQVLRHAVAGHQAVTRVEGHVRRKRRAGGHCGAIGRDRHAVRKCRGRHQVAGAELAAHAVQRDACRHGHAGHVRGAIRGADVDGFPADRGRRHHPSGGQRVGTRHAEIRQVKQGLAGRKMVADITEIPVEHRAGLDGEGLCQGQVHRNGLARRQDAVLGQHAATDGHADAGIDAQRAAALHAVTAQLAVHH